MEKLQKQVKRAQRRLNLQRFLAVATWSLFAWLLVAVIALVVPKIWAIDVDSQVWLWSWAGGATAAALLVAALWTYFIRRSALDAAIEIDQRFELKERVSSSLALDPELQQTEAGQALLADAVRRVERLEVGDKFRVRTNWRAALPLVPMIAIVLLALVADAPLPRQVAAKESDGDASKQIKRSTEDLRKKLAKRRKEAEELNLKEAEKLFEKIEIAVEKQLKKDSPNRKKAMVKLNNLAKEIQKRRQALQDGEQIKKQFNQLKNMKKGPAEKMVQAMKAGDFKNALDEIKKLQDQIKNGKLDEQQKEKLAQQLGQMQKKLGDIAGAHQQAQQQLKQQIQKAMKAGDLKQAGKLQQQLDKLKQQNQQMDQLRQMAQKLGQCKECLDGKNPQGAAAKLDQLAQQLQDMQREIDELEMLDQALDELAQAKDAMNCKACNGQGCGQCQGGLGQFGQGKNGKPGMGLGEGQGKGPRPEQENETGTFDSKVPGNVGPGKAVVTGEVSGPNTAGEAREQIQTTLSAAKTAESQPLTTKRLPRSQRDHVKQYLDSIREGD